MPMILFVCTANRFRSPVAEACFKRELASHKLAAGWEVASAGTWTADGAPATQGAIAGARQLGLDISRHRSRAINARIVKDADLIVVMEHGHKEALQAEFPDDAHKVHLLSEITTGASYDIPDPGSAIDSEICREIDELIHTGFARMLAAGGEG